MVKKINDVSRGPQWAHVIGILDIFGFEKLKTNSFEQVVHRPCPALRSSSHTHCVHRSCAPPSASLLSSPRLSSPARPLTRAPLLSSRLLRPVPAQLCINYVNETLQEQFNETVFAAENRVLKAEGITIDDGALQSSATRLALMNRLFFTLDEQVLIPPHPSPFPTAPHLT